ncbi:MAG: hypothetical protein GY777_02740, partial [Candidatus Brocadiaceae bacterium]|nr:hypothetical protein [Candidatus Brocadiaceae bacterium]
MPIEMPDDLNTSTAPECQGIEEAVSRFENIMLSRIYVQQWQGHRIKNSIRIGMVILFLLAISIFSLSLTLSFQMSKARESIVHMNKNFTVISENMIAINSHMRNMEQQVAYLPKIRGITTTMTEQMGLINDEITVVQHEMSRTTEHINNLYGEMNAITESIQYIDGDVGLLTHDTFLMSRPANSFNKFFPF